MFFYLRYFPFVYFWHHWMIQFCAFGTIAIYYSGHRNLQIAVWREAKDKLQKIRSFCFNRKRSAMVEPIQ